MAFKTPRTVVASAVRSGVGSGNNGGTWFADLGDTVSLMLEVTAQSGTSPTLLVTVEWSYDGVTYFQLDPAVDTFTSVGPATPKVVKTFPVRAPNYRVVWTLGGTTPSYTFAVTEYVTA